MLMSSHIRDINLWESGALKIQWVRDHMPLLAGIEKDFIETKPFAGMKVALSVHMEAKTARLCLCLAAGGADMYATGCNPLSTQDDVAAALVHEGLNVFAIHGATMDEYEADLRRVLEVGPNIIIDDGLNDIFIKNNIAMHEQMVEMGIDHDFTVRPGRHSWDYWVNSLDYHMMFFQKAFARGTELMNQ